ncbi:hypothetical protein BKA70DRAFT_1556489 [Coprinopsis sp. MPI-PUGE-AT-0042]|nr:hypothetical protein BKA70DRAFT_1556489 [Coprinopsis sp. MPI-PUGE-AT-0042]
MATVKIAEQPRGSFGESSRLHHSDPSVAVAARLQRSLRNASAQASQYEHEMKDLESSLSENLSNFRAIDSSLGEAFDGLQRNTKRANRALKQQVPHITSELNECKDILEELSETLPTIRTQVQGIGDIYDSGRQKAKDLVDDLTWLNTEFYERWRLIIFTSSSPVSVRYKLIMRTLFAVSFVLCCWLSWVVLRGGYRAYRHRLVWGERLLS